MNYNNKPQRNTLKTIAIIAVCAAILGVVIALKMSTENGKELRAPGDDDLNGVKVAVPDTTIDTTLVSVAADTASSVLPDTILGRDERAPYEAGYEDGYTAGCDDGVSGTNGESYDDENNFRKQQERKEYARGYKEGYSKGFEDGSQGKQFNIGS